MTNNNEKKIKDQPYCNEVANLITKEEEEYNTKTIPLSDTTEFSMRQCIQDNITHQNKGFLTALAPGQADDRESYDIISPMIETAIANTDLDANNIDPYVDNPDYMAHEIFIKALIKNYIKQTSHGQLINELEYLAWDDGNVLVRKVDTEDGDFIRPVLPQNIIFVDPSVKHPEDTIVIEKDVKNQTQLRIMTDWGNMDLVREYCNSGSFEIPYYDIRYRYGELNRKTLNGVIKEVHGREGTKGNDDDLVMCLTIMVKPQVSIINKDTEEAINGIIVFAEELKPETIKITSKIKVTRYKPYEFLRMNGFKGRTWGYGYREIGRPYQNRANELGNQIRDIMKVASKMVFWSKDKRIAGKNVLSSIKNGQILKTEDLNLLNNVFPNLSLFAEEWNRNISECEKALKAFEVASGEALPSSTSATAIAVSSQSIGRYYNFKREIFGLFLGTIWKRWGIPKLLAETNFDEAIKIIGDSSFIEKVVDAYLKGWFLKNVLKMYALRGQALSKDEADKIIAIEKEKLMKNEDFYLTAFKDFKNDAEIYVGINTVGEVFNKQGVISNRLALLPNTPPEFMLDEINGIREMLNLKPFPRPTQQQVDLQNTQVPQKEKSAQDIVLQENGQIDKNNGIM